MLDIKIAEWEKEAESLSVKKFIAYHDRGSTS
jgi:hypothetical protein